MLIWNQAISLYSYRKLVHFLLDGLAVGRHGDTLPHFRDDARGMTPVTSEFLRLSSNYHGEVPGTIGLLQKKKMSREARSMPSSSETQETVYTPCGSSMESPTQGGFAQSSSCAVA
jgi:hypothetical protein